MAKHTETPKNNFVKSDEAEAKRIAQENENKRLAVEAETKRLAEETAAKSKALIEQKSGALSEMKFDDFAGQGLENVLPEYISIPRIAIIQTLSDEVKPSKARFIKGAKPGDIVDVSIGDLYEPPLLYLPVHFEMRWLEWAPRQTNRGLIAIHPTADILDICEKVEKKDAFPQYFTEDGNRIIQTAQFFGLNLSAGARRSFISMGSTQLKKSRIWLNFATSEKAKRANGSIYTPPLFYRTYDLSAVQESNNQGDWFGWAIKRSDKLEDLGDDWRNIFQECVAFRESLMRGRSKADLSDLDSEDAGQTIEGDAKAM